MTAMSFRARLTLRWTLAFGLLLGLANITVYMGIRGFLVGDLDAQLRTLAGTELASAVDTLPLHVHDFPETVFTDQSVAEKFVQIIAPDGRVVVQSAVLGSSPALVPADELRASEGSRPPIFGVTVLGRPARMIALPADDDGQRLLVAVGVFTDRLQTGLRRTAGVLMLVWLGGLGMTALLGTVIAARAVAPIARITDRAAAIARGNFSARLDPPPVDDEIGRMSTLLNRMLERLHAALEANRRFAADASHELRGPLTAMLGELDVTLKRDRTAEEYRETLDVVRERLREVVDLTGDLMLLVRAQEGQAKHVVEVALVPRLRQALRSVVAAAGERQIELRLDALPDMVAYGDEHLLARVFENLLRNAVQYNRDGGRVEVSGHFDDAAGEWTTGFAVVEIRDTGNGIPEADRDRIFERFYRTDESRSRRTGGVGLGLSICREVVTLFGGSVRVLASSPEGSTFEVRLPGARGSAESTTEVILDREASIQPPARGV
jgi:two-component system OmpR family sensor kinase